MILLILFNVIKSTTKKKLFSFFDISHKQFWFDFNAFTGSHSLTLTLCSSFIHCRWALENSLRFFLSFLCIVFFLFFCYFVFHNFIGASFFFIPNQMCCAIAQKLSGEWKIENGRKTNFLIFFSFCARRGKRTWLCQLTRVCNQVYSLVYLLVWTQRNKTEKKWNVSCFLLECKRQRRTTVFFFSNKRERKLKKITKHWILKIILP